MRIPFVHHPDYHCRLPPGHRFPMGKFKALHAYLLRKGIAGRDDFCRPGPLKDEVLLRTHQPPYVQAFRNNQIEPRAFRRIGLPWSADLVRRTHIAVSGTLLTARLALRHGLCCNTAGGTHHAFPGHGSGFCIYNDIAVAARQLRHEGLVGKMLIIDLDVHQGDGTHFIFREDPSVFTFSIHCEKNFPVKREPGDHDLELPESTRDNDYLACLNEVLPDLLDRTSPDLVFYDAGVDVHRDDRIGRFSLTDRGLEQRERLVMEAVRSRGIPLAGVIGGGYDQDLTALVQRHAWLHRVAREFA
ncbi:MAG: histone deacetylase [Oceanipulchritudo sp.]